MRTWRALAAVGCAGVAVIAATTGATTAAAVPAASATPAPRVARAQLAAADPGSTDHCTDGFGGVTIASGLPPSPCLTLPGLGITRWSDSVLPFNPVTQQTRKAKVTITLPPLLFRGFELVCSNSFPPAFACPFDTHLPPFDESLAFQFYGIYVDVWVRSPAGVQPRYGMFPPVNVSLLAFGSIPVTATVNLSQVYDSGGVAQAFHLQWISGVGLVPGKIIPGYEEYGPVPRGHGREYAFEPAPHVTGPVIVRVSNVKVDGVPLDVGPACQTRTVLDLTARGGFHLGTSVPVEGQPGEYTPQGSSYLHGSVDIPPFSGCRNGGEDLDPLLTGMVSAPDNHIDVFQSGPLQITGCYFFPNDPDCGSLHPQTARTAAARLSPQMRAALQQMTTAQLRTATSTRPPGG